MNDTMKTPRSTTKPRPVVLCILDGWGYSEETDFNAIRAANTPNYDRLWASCPRAMVATSGTAVGLPAGQMGNSEVGHMNLGGGRVVKQDLPRIDDAIADGTLATNPVLQDHIKALKASGGTCHLMGLVSPGGVHSHQDHITALAKTLSEHGIKVSIHAFLDGRDTPPKSAVKFVAKLEADIETLKNVTIATVSGRYYAMDRDNRWDRVEKAWRAITLGEGRAENSADDAIATAYSAKNESDEFILPSIIGGYAGIRDGDGLLMANFRADRAREILAALCDPAFDGFTRSRTPHFVSCVGMSEYSSTHNSYMATLFPSVQVRSGLGEVVSTAGLKQLRIAETEKYAHVTFFFNGGEELKFKGEDRILVPSPNVATYDLKPEMSAYEVTERLIGAIQSDQYDLIVVNYANPDMVGHTGVMSAAVKAVEVIDKCLGQLSDAVIKAGGAMLLTADHGNIEKMQDPITGVAHTAHTEGDVPLLLIGHENKLVDGKLADIAPTILELMQLPQPREMSGHSLLSGE